MSEFDRHDEGYDEHEVKERYYRHMDKKEDGNFLSGSLTMGQFLVFATFILTTGIPSLINAYKDIWEMQRDIQDIKTKEVIEVIKDLGTLKSDINKSIADLERAVEKEELTSRTISGRLDQNEYLGSQRNIAVSRLIEQAKDHKKEIEELEKRVNHLEVVSGVYDRHRVGGQR